jgi:3-hydroxyacyl-CoA dehydrogenase/enoyl-CoA hydratase/3-hydroxybutyryl-CoA epimerase
MVMGTGFAPFLGGPLRYADFIGIRKIVSEMQQLSRQDGYFAPCRLLLDKAEQGTTFYQEKD